VEGYRTYEQKRLFVRHTVKTNPIKTQIIFSLHRLSDKKITNKCPRWNFSKLVGNGKGKG